MLVYACTNARRRERTHPDLMLYSGNCVVLFYGSAGGYSYTRIGQLTSTDGLKEALGTGSIRVTFAKQE